jgi:hypothetical protein
LAPVPPLFGEGHRVLGLWLAAVRFLVRILPAVGHVVHGRHDGVVVVVGGTTVVRCDDVTRADSRG